MNIYIMEGQPVKGLVIFNNANGNLCYSRYFNDKGILSKETGYKNITFDQTDPHKLAAIFFKQKYLFILIVKEKEV